MILSLTVPLSFVIFRYILIFLLLPFLKIPEPASLDLKIHFTHSAIWITNYFFYSAGYFYFRSSIQKQKDLLKATKEKATKDKEAAELENAALRAQINPHFLFNTLNYFYNKVGQLQPEVADGIAALADIMRSSIRTPDADGLIPLEEEISNIEQLISIYELRYNHSVHISFNQQGSDLGLRILPHILNTLVENGFKHGDLHNANHPLTIKVNIENKQLHFTVHDKKRIGPKELSHGIGMNYIRTHLNSVYKDRFTLHIKEDKEFYTITLNIDLSIVQSISTLQDAVAGVH